MALDDKFDDIQKLIDTGKEKGYLTYDQVNDLLPGDIHSPDDLDDLLTTIGTQGIDVLEGPKPTGAELDKKFDGATRTKPDGVIYLVTGAGGARVYNPEQQDAPATWQPFTDKFVSIVNSFTVVDASGDKLSIRQITKDGKEVDRFVVTKN